MVIAHTHCPRQAVLKDRGLEDWLLSKWGKEDFLTLREQHFTDIYPQLNERLLLDLQEHLPKNDGCSARAVVYLDTIEAIREDRASQEKIDSSQRWLRDLYHPDSGLLVVMSGRDRLQWDRDSTSDYSNPNHLEQHLVGGLSKSDAVLFLANCQIVDEALQKAILAVSLDTETHARGSEQRDGYHAFSLGLCADTCWNLVQRNEIIDPDSFDMSSADTQALAARFLRSMGGDGAYAAWLKSLALTPQFDEVAARTCFSEHAGAEQDAAWQALASYSFFRRTQLSGWYALHARMRESLADRQQRDNFTLWQSQHHRWHHYWQDRSENSTDTLAARAWYHTWCTEPDEACDQWIQLAKTARQELRMADHFNLLDWWTPCKYDTSSTDEESRGQHAVALHSLGNELIRATLGDRAAHIQRAIECYEAALRVRTEQAFPKDWAATQNNLANAYRDIPGGDRAANIQRAIECYEAALRVFTEQAFPQDWATTQNNLANAYRDIPGGDRAANIQRAIECYEAALRVRTEQAFPQQWAATQNNLATAYGAIPGGDRAANIQRAIECYEAALRVRTEQAFPQDWAATQNNLANAYGAIPGGDRAANIQRAIECYEAALRVRTEQTFPQDWAMTQNNLATAYGAIPGGDRAANIQRAIECYEAALRVRTEQAFPQDWAMTQNNLAIAYGDIPGGDRAANIQRAIECCEAALRVRTEQALPQDWAMTQFNLAIAYGAIPGGDRAANIQRAIECYEAALRVYTEQAFPREYKLVLDELESTRKTVD